MKFSNVQNPKPVIIVVGAGSGSVEESHKAILEMKAMAMNHPIIVHSDLKPTLGSIYDYPFRNLINK